MMLLEQLHPSYKGNRNSQFGSVWVHRDGQAKKIKQQDVESALKSGWALGRKEPETPKPRKKVTLKCVRCGSLFDRRRADRELCPKCVKSDIGKIAAQRGTHAGWHYRKGETSYPERYFEDVLQHEKIDGWEREKKVGRWFIDFAFADKKIAVEIDGRQHDERQEQDKIKDDYLREHGWTVYRIKWFNPKNEVGKSKLHPQVKAVLDKLR